MKKRITQEELKEVLFYLPETGDFIWRNSRGRVMGGGLAGCVRRDGYRYIKVNGRMYLSHRLAWLYIYGDWPKHGIDHINGDKADNRIKNLRDVPGSVNQRNSYRRKDNSSGHTGVYLHKATGKWGAVIRNQGGKLKWLGSYKKKKDAIAARKRANAEWGYTDRHGEGKDG